MKNPVQRAEKPNLVLRSSPLRPRVALGSLLLCFVAAGTGACSDGDGDDGGAGDILVLDENNYSATATLTIPIVETEAGTNVEFCLDDLVANLQCHELQPIADIDNVSFLQIPGLSKDEVKQRMEADTLATSDVKTYMDYHTDHSANCVNLADMSSFGTPINVETDYTDDPDMTYLVLFSKGTSPGVGAQSMMFLEPTAGAGSEAPAKTGCDMLEFVADLHSSAPLSIPNEGPWAIDWRGLTKDSQGNPVKFNKIDRLVVGFYENLTLTDLEEQIFDLEELPKDLYEIALTGQRDADLADAVHTVSGEKFSGFEQDGEGVWIFGLLCGGCQTPAPIVLSTIKPVF